MIKRTKGRRGTNEIGPNIRAIREKITPELSQNDLSIRVAEFDVSLDRPSITRIENGKRFLRDYEIRAIAKVLGVSVGKLFGEK